MLFNMNIWDDQHLIQSVRSLVLLINAVSKPRVQNERIFFSVQRTFPLKRQSRLFITNKNTL